MPLFGIKKANIRRFAQKRAAGARLTDERPASGAVPRRSF